MAKLNATIKIMFCCGELALALLSLVFVVVSGLVLTGRLGVLSFPNIMPTARIALLLSLSVLFCSFYGCNGALRQTRRTGCFAGRKILVSVLDYACLSCALLETLLLH